MLLPHTNDWGDKNKYEEFGLRLRPGGIVQAEPWNPRWIKEDKIPVDDSAMSVSQRTLFKSLPKTDPWIENHFGFKNYRGPGQALAVRSVLHMPENETLLVILPTGEGKSLLYQALHSKTTTYNSRCCSNSCFSIRPRNNLIENQGLQPNQFMHTLEEGH